MKKYKNRKELNKEWSQFGFQINEKGELLTHDKKNKKKIRVGKLKSFDKAPQDEIEQAKKFYGIKWNKIII